ncbi:hypothetical protein K469DRAFT_712812 [Zopfia rhizophila CBS 207.26]|uniref:DUF4139 domain-containing protein n=1 Tax=Zopfia rhizophila CBS 207.26 TaxID=1314779 RepID=A0A6A6DT27_9PEZI|nr:hypothetical protein K469DRAFT_712812 [Zopfia rhizophila CBS 207.26]
MFGNQGTGAGMLSDPSKQVFNIKDLPTKSVTLYPTRAHVTRDIHDVMLKPGANEVEIYGLSPTVDEHSIQIEGKGAATIVDMTVELMPNRDIFEEIYPQESDTSDADSDQNFHDSDDETEAVRTISKELKNLRLRVTEATETQNSATERLSTLDKYAKSVTSEHNSPDEITKLLQKYEEDRSAVFQVHSAATQTLAALKKQIKRNEHKKLQAGKEARKEKDRIAKAKAKDQRRKQLQKSEKRKEAKYIKQERLRYWPKKVYKITLLLESSSFDTPSSSRRNSIDSITLAQSPRLDATAPSPGKAESSTSQTPVSLLLSYVTKEAGWSPRYDLRVSSIQKTATIVYRTEFLNRTSETWKDAKLSFSTSQTSYQGLDDVVPFMHVWHVRLSKYDSGEGGLFSTEEARKPRRGRPVADTFNRGELFGLDDNYIPALQSKRPLQVQQANNYKPQFGSNNNTNARASLFGSTSHTITGGGLFGSSNWSAQQQAVEQVNESKCVEQAPRAKAKPSLFSGHKKDSDEKDDHLETICSQTIEEETNTPEAVEFEEPSWEDNGLTATYDVPGVRTLTPSSMTRRHKIASLNASNIHLSHICVPKLRSAAFLRAKIRNPSGSVTLLKGSAGVTLDGSFLGNMTLPRVSPGQVFDLPLGVDPAIRISYPKPAMHRSTQGIIFNKESAQVFSRSIWLDNTRSQPIELLVLDQVPVSEDERLRIIITTPKGLAKEGDSVRAGVSAKEGSSGAVATTQSTAWGSAVAKLKKNGEVNWTVKLGKGQGCLLKLDYEARLPPSEKMVPA